MKKFNKEGLRSDKGFTMIELIIVIAIMGILAAILVPSFTQMTRKSRFNADLNTIKHVQTQIELYMAEHDGEFPTGAAPTHDMDLEATVLVLIDQQYLKASDLKNAKLDLQSTKEAVTPSFKIVGAPGDANYTANAALKVGTGNVKKLAENVSERDEKFVIVTP